VDKQICARMAYEGLLEFARCIKFFPESAQHLQHVHFVNIDRETTDAMVEVMKTLYDKKHMFILEPSENKPKEEAEAGLHASDTVQSNSVDAGTDADGTGSPQAESRDPRQSANAADSADDHLMMNMSEQVIPASQSGDNSPSETSNSKNSTVFESSDEGEQFSSETSSQSHFTPADEDMKEVPAVNGDAERHSETSPDAPTSSTTAKTSDICKEQVPACRELACGVTSCNDCSKKSSDKAKPQSCVVAVGRDGERSEADDDITGSTDATAAAAAAAALDHKDNVDGWKQDNDSAKRPRNRTLKKEDCVICLDQITDSKKLDCGHEFCANCINDYFEKGQPKCPSCGKLFGMLKGNQPPGTFSSRQYPWPKLPGNESHGVIEITYNIPDGVQTVSNLIRNGATNSVYVSVNFFRTAFQTSLNPFSYQIYHDYLILASRFIHDGF